MKLVFKFVLLLVVLLPLLTPNIACALPNLELSPAEHSCCAQMKQGCGSVEMPKSHSCCHKEVPMAGLHNAGVETKVSTDNMNLRMMIVFTIAIGVPAPAIVQGPVRWHRSTLRHSPPDKVTALRI